LFTTLYMILSSVICFLCRRSKSYTVDTALSHKMWSWYLGTFGCSPAWHRLLAYKSGLGYGTYNVVLMLSKWCNFSFVSWFSAWTWFLQVCAGVA
jgi:hypothetical protein